MKNKQLKLTINPKLLDAIIQKSDERAQSPQEYIIETVRSRVFAPPQPKSKAGRPKKVDDKFIQYFTRDR
ncbi:hypothetical protein C4580_05750 [Candidatus Woesearchaeota archaeon]|nr:MAG: hypothetical protein C4580_05750 [Candidatus Woesearchaeota archaeon]